MGKFGKPFGVQGWIKVISYADPVEQLLNYLDWYYQTSTNSDWQPIEIDEKKAQGKGLVVHIKGYDAPEAVNIYTNALIAIDRAQLPDLAADEYYWCDLEGLAVINQQGETLGTIDYLFATVSNDVIVVKGKKLHYIPYIQQDFVIEVSLEKKQMIVNWQES